jgi:hypothetical protein
LVASFERGPTEEAAFFLGPEGLKYMAEACGTSPAFLPVPREMNSKRGLFWRHTMLVNDVRIAFSLGMDQPSSPVKLRRTIPEWELTPGPSSTAGHHERFVLSERFREGGKVHFHRPDCLFLVYPTAKGLERTVACFLEGDRNTEAMRRIREKVAAYRLYWKKRRFADAFGAVAMRVLFVLGEVTTTTRIDSMREELRSMIPPEESLFVDCFRFALARDLRADTVLEKPIWYEARSERPRYFFQPVNSGEDREQRGSTERVEGG